MKVAIKLMQMHSDPGYVASYGYTKAVLVSEKTAANCAEEVKTLLALDGKAIKEEDLNDKKRYSRKSGACNYRFVTGIYDVPEGMIIIQKTFQDISTTNYPYSYAWIVGRESLKSLYEERSKIYQDLASSIK